MAAERCRRHIGVMAHTLALVTIFLAVFAPALALLFAGLDALARAPR